jgi:hypothetical protein
MGGMVVGESKDLVDVDANQSGCITQQDVSTSDKASCGTDIDFPECDLEFVLE